MRPNTIVWFERIILGTLILGMLNVLLSWDEMMADASSIPFDPTIFILGTTVFALLLTAGLTLLVSRRRSKVAMWIFIALFILGLPSYYDIWGSGDAPGVKGIMVLQSIAQIVAIGLLFVPQSRRWMRGERSFNEVFE